MASQRSRLPSTLEAAGKAKARRSPYARSTPPFPLPLSSSFPSPQCASPPRPSSTDGFCTRSLSLVAAATAWSDGLKTALLTLDMIISRRKSDSLKTTKEAGRMAELPVEMWQMVKGVLHRAMVYDAEEKMVWRYHFHHMSLEFWDEAPEFYELPHLGNCEWCWQELTDEGGAPRVFKDNEKAVVDMLRDFHLITTASKPISRDDMPEFDTACLSPAFGERPLALLDFTSSVTRLPNEESKKRFRVFCSTFPTLEVASSNAPTVSLVPPAPARLLATKDDNVEKKPARLEDRLDFRRACEKGELQQPGWLLLL